jgi:hypothetical protein
MTSNAERLSSPPSRLFDSFFRRRLEILDLLFHPESDNTVKVAPEPGIPL